MNFKTFALTTVAAFGISTAASAATLSLSPGGTATLAAAGTAGTNFRACAPGDKAVTCYNLLPGPIAVGDSITTFFSAPVGLTIDGPATIKVTFLGKEANNKNVAFSMAGGEITTAGGPTSYTTNVGGPGLLDFNFESISNGSVVASAGSAGVTGTAGIAFGALFNGGRSVYAFFDDSGANNNRDWDDMLVLIEVSPIPLPASALLLLGGLGGIAAIKRRRKAA